MGNILLTDTLAVGMVGSFSVWHWLIVLAVVLILFGGGGKIPRLMKDLGSGIKQFKSGMKEEDEATTAESRSLEDGSGAGTGTTSSRTEESKKAVNG